MEKQVDVAIIGLGSAGLYALSQVRKQNKTFILINGGELGTTCARVGCMPSKALIQVAEDYHRRKLLSRYGIEGGDQLKINMPEVLEHVQDLRDIFVDRVLSNSTDEMPEEWLLEGYAKFIDQHTLQVDEHIIHADKIIIATGSRPIIPNAWQAFSDRIFTTDDLFELEDLPQSIAVIGLGAIGLEIGQSLHRLGVNVTGIDQLETIAHIQDPTINKMAIDIIGKEFPLWLGQEATVTETASGQLRVTCGDQSIEVDKVFASLGRQPNLDQLGLEKLNIPLEHNPNTMQIADTNIFIAGDASNERAILHEAGDEGKIAGYNASHDKVTAFQRKTPFGITFCQPNIAYAGAIPDLNDDNTAIGEIRFAPVGRALIMGENKGILRVYANKQTAQLLACEMIAPHGEHLANLVAWSIQQQLTVFDLLKMPFYHPVLEEALQAALYDLSSKLTPPDVKILELDELT